ncbi:MAG: ATP-dependent RecD-like DNA helicase, partial [Anaerolineaceae bacterium]|nr:ATP-dependent RecD-like DNA helicase [Anaerolineaceae bacterium]
EHGIASGPWERREEWLNQQIAAEWKNRGAFPGLGSALEALGMRLGTALLHKLALNGDIQVDGNPWPLIDTIFRGKTRPPQAAYKADLDAIRRTWGGLSDERRQLLELLSRFELTPSQAKRWFDRDARLKATSMQIDDVEILANPYRISESDVGSDDDPAISVGSIDMGILPDTTISARHPVPPPSAVGSQLDARRVRAALVAVLRAAANTGDSLLSAAEAIERLQSLDLAHPCNLGTDWLEANGSDMAGVIELLRLPIDTKSEKTILALQLTELKKREERLEKVLRARAGRTLESLSIDWKPSIIDAIRDSGGYYNENNPRHVSALEEQNVALENITTRKLSVLVGRAGTGKTSVLGALLRCQPLVAGGILLLAPTGKARVKLGKATGAEAATVAQFLYGLGRYDGMRQCPTFVGDKHQKEKTVVIDECSMLTMDDLAAVFEALNLGHVQRIILVGDPNQLPPIGVGRPFADLVASLEESAESSDEGVRNLAEALGRLTVEVRTTADAQSDTLRLASWFTRDPQPVDADRVLSDLERGIPLNDLDVVFWKTPEELHERLLEQFQKHLGLKDVDDMEGFNRALGFSEDGMIPFDAPEGAENFQILSPVRMHPHGVYDLNRWLQRQFRATKLQNARESWGVSLGDETIVVHDKVIQNRNQKRYAYDGKSQSKIYLANGEIGIIANHKGKYLNVVFAGRPGYRVGYQPRDFPSGSGPHELAYALTVHKAQGSEFRRVFVILPQNCRVLSRELLYTALTRSRDHLILLVEGDTASTLYEFTKPEKSETARRNTNLFRTAIRERLDDVPYAEYLIHRCENGQMVRSKSELVIANMLHQMNINYMYENPVEGEQVPGKVRPDFSFDDPAGDLILWEHLGMLSRDDYRKAWEWKKDWYAENGFIEGKNLFTTQDDEKGGLDSTIVKEVAETIQSLI